MNSAAGLRLLELDRRIHRLGNSEKADLSGGK